MNNKVIIGIIAVVVVIGGIVLLQQSDTGNKVLAGNFSTDITGLAEAKASETIELKNGDTYNLSASIVKKTIGNNVVKMLAYNGMIPGPMIKVDQGAEVTLNFTNNTDVDTTIHSHGVRLENKFDGVPDVTQKEVKPGESFTYRIKFPDEGMYWYHPHIREDYAQELGLYGNYLVTPNDPNYWSPVNREVALFVDDILIENGKIATFSKASADRTLMGRFGNTMLVNGETNYALATKAGEVIRFYITNSANTRVFNLSIPGAKIKLVGADGGKYERETWIDGVVLGPSERAVVEVLFANAGSYKLEHKTPDRTYTLGTIIVSNEKVAASFEKEFAVLRSNKDIQSEIDAFRSSFNKPADKRLKLTINIGMQMQGMMQNNTGGHNMNMMGGQDMMSNSEMVASGDPIEWEENNVAMNVVSNPAMMKWIIQDEDTGKENMDIDWKFKVGDKVKIKITNDPNSMHPMQHPIHFHGQRFLVLSTNGKPNNNLVWKDTTLIQNGDTVEILVEMTNPGEWMAHCHIAEHLEASMMFGFKVE
ncbi:MAG: Multicopper oxidase family protein [Parcubacteria group bacterium GW2011_GWF2_40_69]|nr:MAG: Multicopper oxidase family protein [Parcubacteria group bacterium GW2011_GWF1_39_37]KKR52068.1 MAG: Multicopper oxidase family protein [Parcubacteria group bacterium GW2011_GWE1_40_20]KKR69238.1 MAG: Multicopper oxidase family protein [Parcubacteria group bacterium GW2011_GWF2_40_69]KKS35601.1 MAG: Multicopper oxidase family protein [Parcubacteria group bacterium GW2011_GWE2_42_14]HBD24496.1 copper oxidase [Candidatus Zambryskibacteria bacterium]